MAEPSTRDFISALASRIDCSGKCSAVDNYSAVSSLISTVMKCERARLFLAPAGASDLSKLAALADDGSEVVEVAVDDGLVGTALTSAQVSNIIDDDDVPDDVKEADAKAGRGITRTILTVPVRLATDKPTVVVQAFNKERAYNGGKFDTADVAKLRLLGQLCAANLLMADVARATDALAAEDAREFGQRFAATELEAAAQAMEFAKKVIPAPIVRATLMMGEDFDVEVLGDQAAVLNETTVTASSTAANTAKFINASDVGAEYSLLAAPVVPGTLTALGTCLWARPCSEPGFSSGITELATGVGKLMGLALAKGWCFEEFPESMMTSASSVARILPVADRLATAERATTPAAAAAAPEAAAANDDDQKEQPATEEPAEAAPEEPTPAPVANTPPPAAEETAVAVVHPGAADLTTPQRPVDRSAMEQLSPYGYDVSHSPVTDAQLRIEFSHYDTDGSGKLSKAEFKRKYMALDWAGLTPSDRDFERTWKQFCGADEALSYDEFCLFMLRRVRM